MMTNQSLLEAAKGVAREAGEYLVANSNKAYELEWGEETLQGYKAIKSEVDEEVDRLVVGAIRELFPDHSILSEESGMHEMEGSEFVWVVDPLHDTVAFVRGNQPEFSVTFAVVQNNEVVVGVIYQPVLKKMYWATKSGGAFVNGKKLTVSVIDTFEQANLSIQHNVFKYGVYEKLIELIKKVKRMYALGSAMFPELAAGKVDVVVSYKQSTYDYAASKLIVEEAGGKVTQLDGMEIPLRLDNERRYDILASNGVLHEQVVGEICNSG